MFVVSNIGKKAKENKGFLKPASDFASDLVEQQALETALQHVSIWFFLFLFSC